MKTKLTEFEVREKDADFVQQARELSNFHYANRTDSEDRRAYLTFWLAKGHKSVFRIHKKTFKKIVSPACTSRPATYGADGAVGPELGENGAG